MRGIANAADSAGRRESDVVRRDESGASSVEYGLLVFAIAALIALIVFALGGVVNELFIDTCDGVRAKAATTAACS